MDKEMKKNPRECWQMVKKLKRRYNDEPRGGGGEEKVNMGEWYMHFKGVLNREGHGKGLKKERINKLPPPEEKKGVRG